MKIYSNTLTDTDLSNAKRAAGSLLYFERWNDLRKTRVRTRGWDILLGRTDSRRHFNTGQYGAGEEGAASRDDYGRFLAKLYDRDPGMRAAYYTSREDFHQSTRFQYDNRPDQERS